MSKLASVASFSFIIIRREVPGTDVSSSVETDKENDSNMLSDGEENTTDQLLDSTYQLNPAHLTKSLGKSVSRSLHPLTLRTNPLSRQ